MSGLLSNQLQNWTTTSLSADQVIFNGLASLRARSREQYYNNTYAKRLVSMIKTNVVGDKGISVQSKASGLSGSEDKAAQAAIEEAFKRWKEPQNCDYIGRKSFQTIQNLVISSLVIDGEAFVKINRVGKSFTLDLIDPVLIDINYMETGVNGNNIIFGIEYDSRNKPIAYHLNQQTANQKDLTASYYTGERSRIPAEEILHIFVDEFVGQRRGIPWMSNALERMKMLNGFEEASLVAARVGAAKMGFFYSESGDEYVGDRDQGHSTSAEAGTFEQLPDGVRFEQFNPDYPTGEFAIFAKQCLRGISAGVDVQYNTLANDLEGVNFSSLRHGAVEERNTYKGLQTLIIDQFIKPVFEQWIRHSHLCGTITIKGLPLKGPVEAYLDARYQGRRWDWVDPYKDTQAKNQELLMGTTTRHAIIREKGLDPEEVFAELKMENEMLEAMGLKITLIEPQQDQQDEPKE